MGDGLSATGLTTSSSVGRTHRMMQDALAQVRAGKTVTVIGLYNEGAKRLEQIAMQLGASPEDMRKLLIVKFHHIWDLENVCSPQRNDYVYLVDHKVIETEFCNALNMLHKYDK